LGFCNQLFAGVTFQGRQAFRAYPGLLPGGGKAFFLLLETGVGFFNFFFSFSMDGTRFAD